MAQIKCQCGRWCGVEEDVRFCIGCGRPLDVEDFRELIEIDNEVARIDREFVAFGTRTMVLMAIVCILALAPISSALWAFLVFDTINFFGLGIIFWKWYRTRKHLRERYERIWSLPATFRPSVSKP